MLLLLKILFLIPFGSALAAAEPVIEARAEAETEIDSYGQTALEADSQLTLHEVIVHTFEREPGLLAVAARLPQVRRLRLALWGNHSHPVEVWSLRRNSGVYGVRDMLRPGLEARKVGGRGRLANRTLDL